MSGLKIFENNELGELSVLNSKKYGPLFIGYEVADMAGYKKPKDALQNLGNEYKVKLNYKDALSLFSKSKILDFKISHRGLTMVNKPGLYKLASNKNKEFEHWIFFEVLPSIERTGSYNSQPQLPSSDPSIELEVSIKKLEDLKIAKAPEISNINKQSARGKLNTLITTLSHERQISTKALYEQLYYRYAERTGTFIPLEARDCGKNTRDYMKSHAVLAERLYDFALVYFYHGKSVVELFNWDPKQRTLGEFKG